MKFLLFLAEAAAEGSVEGATDKAVSLDWQALLDMLVNWALTTGVKIVIAILILLVSFAIINRFAKRVYKRLQNKHADLTLSRVAYNGIKVVLKALVLICLVGYVGIETASISAVVATLGVGVSLAVQGTLANFAGGVIIILMRPFRIGDFITTNGESGTVEEIKLFYTHIVTPDNRVIYVPNGNVANNVIVNVSAKDTRRVDVVMSVAYDSNIALVKEVIRKVCAANELIFKDPAPFIDVSQYANSSIDLVCRVWVKGSDYWTVNFYLLNEIKKAFDENGIQVPYDTLDVNVITK